MSSFKSTIGSWLGILTGCAIMAAGFVFFVNPYNFVPGGVYGASIVMHNIFPSVQVGTFGYMFDVPLLITSLLLLGKGLGARTIVASLFTPLVMNVISKLLVGLIAVICYFCMKQYVSPYLVFAGEIIALGLCWCPTVIFYNYLIF